jgi:predicted glycosyltransferase
MAEHTILFEIAHPATVHLFRNAIRELQQEDHRVVVTSREKDVTTELLDIYGIDHQVLSTRAQSIYTLPIEWVQREFRMVRLVRRVDPDVIVSEISPAAAHAAAIVGTNAVQFSDTDTAPWLVGECTYRFVDRVYTPTCYQRNLGEKQRRYPGYHELAYLHPRRFTPNQQIVDRFRSDGRPLVVLRLVSWEAHHDAGESGLHDPVAVVHELEAMGANVIVSTENDCPPEITDRVYDLPPQHMHDLLYAADLFVGESATMATESAVLGTPAVYTATVGMGYVAEIADRYKLIETIDPDEEPPGQVLETIQTKLADDRTDWDARRRALLNENEDTTDIILEAITELT